MNNPGIYNLGDFVITAAVPHEGEWIENLEGMLAMSADFKFAYGSGGTAVKAYLQTSFDQGVTVVDIACVTFGQAGKHSVVNFSALTPKTTQVTPQDGALADDTAIDGLLGDRVRIKYVSTGTYAGSTTLRVRACAR